MLDLISRGKFFRAGERRKNARFLRRSLAAKAEDKTNTETNGEKINLDRLHRIFDTTQISHSIFLLCVLCEAKS